MRLLISKLRQSEEGWQPDPDRPVALLENDARPPLAGGDSRGGDARWTFYDASYAGELQKLFEAPVRYDEHGTLERPDPYSPDALAHLIAYDLPARGLGASLLD